MEILETCPVEYRCYCSRERVERALISLGRDELESILREQGGCELTCQFCDKVHIFTAKSSRPSSTSSETPGRRQPRGAAPGPRPLFSKKRGKNVWAKLRFARE